MDILATLQGEMEQLSRAERRISDILFSDTDFAVGASISELAARAAVSPPTVTRFCRRLGCQSFSDFKVRLAQTTFVGSRYLKPDGLAMAPADVAENIVNRAQTALYAMHASLDLEKVEQAVARIVRSDMIYAFGSGGNSAMIAQEIQNRLFRLGLRVTASTDHQMQLMLAASAKPRDVLVVSSVSGRNMPLVRALQAAADYRVFSIAITRPNSPVAEAADLVLAIDLVEGVSILKPTAARFAFLGLVDIVATLAATKIETGATESLRRIKHQVVAYRDKDDREALGD
ncbi:MurR/RpiR family transcriptional regulator [Consotaella aegiceratis]|uniref:MurR/RpiR family transcriptional regulator n=1 Tax=Consotaella aegiceratis TaxID=3097961 RepID=UPI002F4289CA